ncbi:MAG: hypothetical protein JWM76_2255 [Pseudonocardiales bacterium]|nr:hypothetical protein [Pseudonocardiales bacterium]
MRTATRLTRPTRVATLTVAAPASVLGLAACSSKRSTSTNANGLPGYGAAAAVGGNILFSLTRRCRPA